MKKQLLIVLAILCNVSVEAQRTFKPTKKISNAEGTLWGYWGYNRAYFTKSDLHFKGPGYDFTLIGATAHDRPSRKFSEYVDITNITVPQFNLRFGYYFKNKYAISLGYDHMKYVLDDANQVLLNGFIEPGLDSTWSGFYNNQPVTTNRNDFHYENTNGLNYIRVEIMRTDRLYTSRNGIFALSSSYALGTGCILTINDFRFAQQNSLYTPSISGLGISGHLSLRAEFWRHVFVQAELSGGRHNLSKVRIRPRDKQSAADHKYWYGQRNVTVGFFAYLKPKRVCQDCPVW